MIILLIVIKKYYDFDSEDKQRSVFITRNWELKICLFKKKLKQNFKGALINKFNEYGISPTILDNNISILDIKIVLDKMINDKTKTKTIDLLNDYFDIDKPEKTIEFIKNLFYSAYKINVDVVYGGSINSKNIFDSSTCFDIVYSAPWICSLGISFNPFGLEICIKIRAWSQ